MLAEKIGEHGAFLLPKIQARSDARARGTA
jgi:hypothetical protein